MGESDWHCKGMMAIREMLEGYFANDPMVYVSGNLFVFYEPGNRRRHVSPDVLVVKGIPRVDRLNYLIWEEGKAPDLVIELTSASTQSEDLNDKFQLYQDTLRVSEYFVFDPLGDYLKPRLQGYRLRQKKYARIRPIKGRLPSQVLGLQLEAQGKKLRLFDPTTGESLRTPQEEVEHLRHELERLRRQAGEK